MKNIFLLLLLACMATTTQAQEMQETGEPKERKHAIGLQFATPFGNASDEELVGIQYKRWIRPNRAIRVSAMYGMWEVTNPRRVTNVIRDTAFESYTRDYADMFYLNAGIEMHKHFYKKAYLYAAIDLRGGYGSGYSQENLVKNYPETGGYTRSIFISSNTTYDLTRFRVDATPFIGVKLLFNRIAFGTEISAISTGFTSVTTRNPRSQSVSLFDLDAGQFRQRMFINFRF